ncbi:MAG: helix-turn-helix domain-containing protein [Desulfobaccales bacterium]
MPRPKKAPQQSPSLEELLASGDLIAPEELAAGMRVARVTVYQWVRRGVIPHLKIESLIRFDPIELREWLEGKRRADRKVPGGGLNT